MSTPEEISPPFPLARATDFESFQSQYPFWEIEVMQEPGGVAKYYTRTMPDLALDIEDFVTYKRLFEGGDYTDPALMEIFSWIQASPGFTGGSSSYLQFIDRKSFDRPEPSPLIDVDDMVRVARAEEYLLQAGIIVKPGQEIDRPGLMRMALTRLLGKTSTLT